MSKTIALYMRLSKDDSNALVSESILSQKNIIKEFISKDSELIEYKQIEFIDDGYSGYSFERPAITELLKKVKNFEINCIIVKDLSRFGRNSLDTLPYIEKIFPFMNVRFISIVDNLDTTKNITSSKAMDISIKSLVNELYIKDLSKKRKSVNKLNAKKGKYIGNTAPFGYKKDKNDTNKLVIDDGASEIVKLVFDYALKGNNSAQISRLLNDNEVDTPMEYWRKNGVKNGIVSQNKNSKNYWNVSSVLHILKNEMYTGTLIAYKKVYEEINAKNPIPRDESEWIKVPNAFPAIIDKDTFDFIHNNCLRKISNRSKSTYKSLFTRKLYCGHCGKALKNINIANTQYKCLTKLYTKEKACFEGCIAKIDLEKIILNKINTELEKSRVNYNNISKNNTIEKKEKKSNNLTKEVREIKLINNNSTKLFEDYSLGKITESEFRSENEKLLQRKQILKDKINSDEFIIEDKKNNDRAEVINKFIKLDQNVMKLVKKIIVYEVNKIEVILNNKFYDKIK